MRAFLLTLLLGCAMSGAHAANEKAATSDALQAFQGTFDLENAKSLTIRLHGRKLFMQVDGGPTTEIIACSDKAFCTKSGTPRLEFDQYPNGSVAGVRLIQG